MKLQTSSSRNFRSLLMFGSWSFSGAWRLVLGIFLLAAFLSCLPSQALELGKEIERMPKDKRPSPEQIQAAKDEEAQQKKYQDDLWRKLEPQLQDWAKKGKPFLPRAIYPTDLPQSDVPAFPGAEGAGSHSFGGRGGKVFVVTNLDD